MHISSIKLFNTNKGSTPILVAHAEDLSKFPFLMRINGSAKEMLLFFSREFVSNTPRGEFKGCRENDYIGWIHHNSKGLAGVIICDKEYERRVAFSLLQKSMTMYENTQSNWDWPTYDKDIELNTINPEFKSLIIKYQNPEEHDSILKVMKGLQDTKVILYESIDKMLERGEKIDVLVDKSKDLSHQSKQFYIKSKKLNSWCDSCCIS